MEERIKDLLTKYHEGKCSDEELEKLWYWFETINETSKGVWLEEDEVDLLYDKLSQSDRFTRQNKTVRLKSTALKVIAIAASIVLPILIGLFMWQQKKESPQNLLSDSHILQRMPGRNVPKLILKDGTEWDLTAENAAQLEKTNGLKLKPTESGEWVYQSSSSETTPTIHTINTPKASQLNLRLPDGSKVWLNAASSISFPSHMNTGKRIVKIEGEVYFEVAHLPQQPFIVQHNDQQIEVRGTKFNVSAYPEQDNIKTALLEGSIYLKTATNGTIMSPNELANVDHNGNINIAYHADLSNEIAWVHGYFYFNNASINEVSEEIGRWYDIDLVSRQKSSNRKINGKISRNLTLSKLIELMDYLGISVEQSDEKLIINLKNEVNL